VRRSPFGCSRVHAVSRFAVRSLLLRLAGPLDLELRLPAVVPVDLRPRGELAIGALGEQVAALLALLLPPLVDLHVEFGERAVAARDRRNLDRHALAPLLAGRV